ncbi:MAG: SRPBCC family protein [Armatimonadetes bacterium]|nr:SRPBCC family protein [Armatimonadota bacterium]
MSAIEESVLVLSDTQRAYEMLTDFEHYPEFMPGVEEVRRTGETLMHWTADRDGQRKEWDTQVIQMDPEERIAFQGLDGDPPVRCTLTFHPEGQGTRITLLLENDPGDENEVRDHVRETLQNLKAIMDQGPPHRWPAAASSHETHSS